jgi:FKBP-type peptidyl-prolyl cis-trans isomerase
MRRRIVIVPGTLAFGTNPSAGSGLQPDETVVFVIDLVKAA